MRAINHSLFLFVRSPALDPLPPRAPYRYSFKIMLSLPVSFLAPLVPVRIVFVASLFTERGTFEPCLTSSIDRLLLVLMHGKIFIIKRASCR